MAFENLRNKAEVLINTLRQESTAWVVVQELKHATRDKKMDKKTNKELPDPVWVMKYSYDGRFFASGGQDGVVKVWCLSDDPIQERIKFSDTGLPPPLKRFGTAHQICFPNHGISGISGTHGSHQRATTVDNTYLNTPTTHASPKSPNLPSPVKMHSSPSFKKFDKSAINFNSSVLYQPSPLRTFIGHSLAITDLAWSHSEHFLVSSSIDSTVRLWNVLSADCLCTFKHPDIVSSLIFHPIDHSLFLSGCYDGRIRLWSISEKKIMTWNETSSNPVSAVAFTNDGTMAMAGSFAGDCLFFEMPDLRYDTQISIVPILKSLRSKQKNWKITAIEHLPASLEEEDRIVLTCADSKIRIINLRDKSLYRSLKGHSIQTSFIRSEIDESGYILASPSEDKTIFFWFPKKEAEESSWLPGRSTESSKNHQTAKLIVDEQVISTSFAPSQFGYWRTEFKASLMKAQFLHINTAITSTNQEAMYMATGDINGKIIVFKNESTSLVAGRTTAKEALLPSPSTTTPADKISMILKPTIETQTNYRSVSDTPKSPTKKNLLKKLTNKLFKSKGSPTSAEKPDEEDSAEEMDADHLPIDMDNGDGSFVQDTN